MAQEIETHCRIVNVRIKEAGRQDEFMRWMHDRLLRPPFVSAADVWRDYVKRSRLIGEIAELDKELGLELGGRQ